MKVVSGPTTAYRPLVTYRGGVNGERVDKKPNEVYSGDKRIVEVKSYS